MADMDPRDKELYRWVYNALVEKFGERLVESLSDDYGQFLFFKVGDPRPTTMEPWSR